MADTCTANIKISGTIATHQAFVALAYSLHEDGVTDGMAIYIEDPRKIEQELSRAIKDEEVAEFYSAYSRGSFEKAEALCREMGIAYYRSNSYACGIDAGFSSWQPGMADAAYGEEGGDGEPVLCLYEIAGALKMNDIDAGARLLEIARAKVAVSTAGLPDKLTAEEQVLKAIAFEAA